MPKKTRDLFVAIGLLLIGYFFGDFIAQVNNVNIDLKTDNQECGLKQNQENKEDNFKNYKNSQKELSVEELIKLKAKNIDLKEALVKYVIDGDTVVLTNGEKVRYIGIDTPEKGQCWYRQAKNFNQKLVGGKKIRLEIDQSNRDRYQRLLRYVYITRDRQNKNKEEFVNLELVKAGLARVKGYKPDTKYYLKLKQAENYAKLNKRGLWGGCEE